MVGVCLYFQVHQPFRLKKYTVFDIGNSHDYFDDETNKKICLKVANNCYLPTNKILLDLIKKTNGKFKCSFSITGVVLEQFEKYAPEVIDSFKELAKTGCIEFLSETYYHSLSFLYSKEEFLKQVMAHKKKIETLFGQTPKIFRNTELVYNNELAKFIENLGFKGIISEGADHILGWRSPNYVYKPKGCEKIKLLMKNFKLSDDIAFRFSCKEWDEWPLTADKYSNWLNSINNKGDIVNLFMDYETFGEHQWKDSGIFEFLNHFPVKILENKQNQFLTITEVISNFEPVSDIDIHEYISWADAKRDLSAWIGNDMQKNSLYELFQLEKAVKKTNDSVILEDFRKLTISDHFYYMCTKWFNDGDVHKYFNPYESPYDSFIVFMNILNDLSHRIKMKNEELNESFNENLLNLDDNENNIDNFNNHLSIKQNEFKNESKVISKNPVISENPSYIILKE